MIKFRLRRLICIAAVPLFILSGCTRGGDNGADISETGNGQTNPQKGPTYSAVPGKVKKSETVYVTLDSAGAPKKITVTDWLHTDKGKVRVEDKSGLENISIIKGAAVRESSGSDIVWHMESTDLYYTGTANKKLPVSFEFEFFMNNKKISAEEIKGKSGRAIIKVRSVNNIMDYVKINGETKAVYNPVIVIGGAVMSEEKFSSVSVTNGRFFGDGSREAIISVMTPGLKESLGLAEVSDKIKLTDEFTIEAEAASFEMGKMYFAVLPLSALEIGTSLPQTVSDIGDTLSEIDDLRNTIEGTGAVKLINTIFSEPQRLEAIAGALGEAAALYKSNRQLLTVISKYLTDENLNNLRSAAQSAKDINVSDYAQLLRDEKFRALLNDLGTISQSMEKLLPVLEDMQKQLQDPNVKASLDKLPDTLTRLSKISAVFDKNEAYLNALSSLLDSGISEKLPQIVSSLESISDEKYAVLTENSDELIARAGELIKKGSEYKIYTDLADNTQSELLFIYETKIG